LPSTDHYRSFSEIARYEADTYQVLVEPRDSRVLIAAPHGGGIEPGTSEIARALAHNQYSLYLFESRSEDGGRHLHLTSGRFDEPQALKLVSTAQTVITVHGFESEQKVAHVGGRDIHLAGRIIAKLEEAGFTARPDSGRTAGIHPSNLCNRGSTGRGVQLELDTGLRRLFFASLNRAGRRFPTPEFDRFVEAVRSVLE
jgi:phage replication-related protein YjqB (UPF0714/DUF867 family)